MKRKKKKASKRNLIQISDVLLGKFNSHPFSKRFIMFLENGKGCENIKFLKHVYEIEIKLDWSEEIYCKFAEKSNTVIFIFYSTMTEFRDPMFAFEIKVDRKEYLNLIERILDASTQLPHE